EKLVAEFEKKAATSGASQWNALVALAGIYKQDGQHARAVSTYEKAIAQKPNDPTAPLALAHVLNDRGDKAGAHKWFEKALPLIKEAAEREQVLRTLMQLSLDLKQFDKAKKFHKELVTRAKGSFFV